MNKNLVIEIAAEKPYEKGFSYARLGFPATSAEIADLKHRARLTGREDAFTDIRILESHKLKSLVGVRINNWSYKELNFLAHRLQSMSDESLISLNAIFDKQINEGKFFDGVGIIDIINMTYGHEDVMVASYVTNLELLGKFSIQNGLYTALPEIPEIDPNLLNVAKVGELQQKADGGIFYDRYYVVAGEYKPQEVYTSKTVPEFEDEETKFAVFSVALGKSVDNISEIKSVNKEWFHLPQERKYLEKQIKERLECPLSEATCYEVKSAIPQIDMYTFAKGFNIFTLNDIALGYKKAREFDKIKFKAVLEGHGVGSLADIPDIFERLSKYELAHYCDNSGEYFKEYISQNTDARFDDKWLKNIDGAKEGIDLMRIKGAAFTKYGVISDGKHSLFSPVPYGEPDETEEETEEAEEEVQTGGMQL